MKVEISEANYEYLKSLAEPFVDNPDSVLGRIIEQHKGSVVTSEEHTSRATNRGAGYYRLGNLPPMTFTKPISAIVDGKRLTDLKWRQIIAEAIRCAANKGFSPQEIITNLNANAVVGSVEGNGFLFVKEANISFQALDADRSAQAILELAAGCDFEVAVDFSWRANKPQAYAPGKKGVLVNP